MTHDQPPSSGLVAAFVATALGLSAGPTLAQTTSAPQHPHALVQSTNNPNAVHIRLTNQMDIEALNYDHPHDLRVCNLSGRMAPASQEVPSPPGHVVRTPLVDRPVPEHGRLAPVDLKVSYHGKTDKIQPGECYRFRAQTVRLTPTQPLASGGVLDLTVENLSGNGNTESAAAGGPAQGGGAGPQSVQSLDSQLRRDDQQMRAAAAEMNRARAELARTTQDLERARHEEKHVASLEHQTTQAEKKNAQNAEPGKASKSTGGGQQGTPE